MTCASIFKHLLDVIIETLDDNNTLPLLGVRSGFFKFIELYTIPITKEFSDI
jgi:hypothetical protein